MRLPGVPATVLAVGLFAAGCAQADNVNEASPKSKGVVITTTYGSNEGGACASRTDSAMIPDGEFAELGRYNREGGWAIDYTAPSTIEFTEVAQNATTLLDKQLVTGPNVRADDLLQRRPETLTLPPAFNREIKIAQYVIHKAGKLSRDPVRLGEYGTLSIRFLPGAVAVASVHSVFPGWCPQNHGAAAAPTPA